MSAYHCSTPPKEMLTRGRNTERFFNKIKTGPNTYEYEFKSSEQYNIGSKNNVLPSKRRFKHMKLDELILSFNDGKAVLTNTEQLRRKNGEAICPIDLAEEQLKGTKK